MKHKGELMKMLIDRVEEIKRGVLTLNYDEQLRIEIALLYDILYDDIDITMRADIENHM